MVDVFPRETRSRLMSRIRSRWTKQERMLHGFLKGWRIRHTMHPSLPGQPDIFVPPSTLVFVDGCFWHGCPKCYVPPKSRQKYWHPKIQRNRERDKANRASLRRAGYVLITIWEHQMKRDSRGCAEKIRAMQRSL